MSYEKKPIHKVMQMIAANQLYLPAIQRKFVWKPDQIERLFDSIMRGYPIGTFLFWIVKGKKKNDYTFYKFLQDYHERDKYINELAPKPELREDRAGWRRSSALLYGLVSSRSSLVSWSRADLIDLTRNVACRVHGVVSCAKIAVRIFCWATITGQ